MKRLLISMLAATVLTALSGCDSNTSNTTPADNQSNSTSDTSAINNGSNSPSSTVPADNQGNSTSNTLAVNNESNTDFNSTPVNSQSNFSTNGNSVPEVFYGEWTIQGTVAFAPIGALGNDDVKRLLGQKLYYGPDSVRFEGNVLKNPHYRVENINADDFFEFNRVSLQQLGISNKSIAAIHVYPTKDLTNEWYYTDPDSEGGVTYIKDTNTLIMEIGGVYFELVRSN